MTTETRDGVFRRFDTLNEPVTESQLLGALRKLLPKEDEKGELSAELKAEYMAFGFSEREHSTDAWGTWFNPTTVLRRADGEVCEFPSLSSVDLEMLDYWARRAREATNPVLKARYAGLIWDFSPKVAGKSAGVEIARLRIDAVVELAEQNRHKFESEVWQKLEHALQVAIQINDTERISSVRDAILAYEEKHGVDEKAGLWGHAFDLLVGDKKVGLSEEQEAEIVQDMEDRLERLSNPELSDSTVNHWGAELAAQRLARYYRKNKRPKDVRRVLLKLGRAMDVICEVSEPFAQQTWRRKLHEIYRHFGLTSEAEEERKKIRELGPEVAKGMKRVSHEIEITHEEMQGFLDGVLAGTLQESIQRFLAGFIPRRDETERQLKELVEQYPLALMMPTTLIDSKGRPMADIAPRGEDTTAQVVQHTCQNMGVSNLFLHRMIEGLIERHELSAQIVLEWVDQSPAFDPTKRLLLERGVEAYFSGDSVVAVHLLVPQIEDAVRELIAAAGVSTYRPNRHGGMDLLTLDALLRTGVLAEVFGSDDIEEYLRILLTDPRGINLRNFVCHGLALPGQLGVQAADRVFHVLVLLAHVRRK